MPSESTTHVDEEKAKQLLLTHLQSAHISKPVFKSILSSPARLHVISVKCLESLIYTLETIVKSEANLSVLLPYNEVPKTKTKSVVNSSVQYPVEYYSFSSPSSEIIRCSDCDKSPAKCSQCNYLSEICYDCQYKQEHEKCQKCKTNLIYSEQRKCKSCRSSASELRTACSVCNGSGKLRRFEKYLVKEDSIREVWAKCAEKSIPLKVLTSSRGTLVVNETNKNVRAIDYFTDEDVYKVSEHYLRMHENRLLSQPGLQKLYQVQQLLVIPVSIFSARVDNNKTSSNFRFFVVGDNHLVYIPKSNSHNCSVS